MSADHVTICVDCGAAVPVYLIDRPASERPCPAASDRDRRLGQHGHRVPRLAYDAWVTAGRPIPRADEPDFYVPDAGEEDAGLILIQNEAGDAVFRITPEYAEQIAEWLLGLGPDLGLIARARVQRAPR